MIDIILKLKIGNTYEVNITLAQAKDLYKELGEALDTLGLGEQDKTYTPPGPYENPPWTTNPDRPKPSVIWKARHGSTKLTPEETAEWDNRALPLKRRHGDAENWAATVS